MHSVLCWKCVFKKILTEDIYCINPKAHHRTMAKMNFCLYAMKSEQFTVHYKTCLCQSHPDRWAQMNKYVKAICPKCRRCVFLFCTVPFGFLWVFAVSMYCIDFHILIHNIDSKRQSCNPVALSGITFRLLASLYL